MLHKWAIAYLLTNELSIKRLFCPKLVHLFSSSPLLVTKKGKEGYTAPYIFMELKFFSLFAEAAWWFVYGEATQRWNRLTYTRKIVQISCYKLTLRFFLLRRFRAIKETLYPIYNTAKGEKHEKEILIILEDRPGYNIFHCLPFL